jgi:hypothetical protein
MDTTNKQEIKNSLRTIVYNLYNEMFHEYLIHKQHIIHPCNSQLLLNQEFAEQMICCYDHLISIKKMK